MGSDIQTAADSNLSAAMAIVAVVLFMFGIVLGEHIGESVGERCATRRDYIWANVWWMLAGSLASAIIWASGLILLVAVSLGILAGGIAGTKIAFGESIGPWRYFDSKLRANRPHVQRAKDPAAQKRRKQRVEARRKGMSEPEYISVSQPGSSSRPRKDTHKLCKMYCRAQSRF